jgi:uncharacterized DUF497 family protein
MLPARLDQLIYHGYNKYVGDEIELEWDEVKRQQTLEERGLDFKLARYILSDPNLVCRVDDRREHTEIRYIAYGMVYNEVFCLCYTMRNKTYRIISLRRTHHKERKEYYGTNTQDDCQGN